MKSFKKFPGLDGDIRLFVMGNRTQTIDNYSSKQWRQHSNSNIKTEAFIKQKLRCFLAKGRDQDETFCCSFWGLREGGREGGREASEKEKRGIKIEIY